MRRRLSEQPRVIAAQALLVLALLGGGYAIAQIVIDEDRVPPATATALDRARSDSRATKGELAETRKAVEGLNARVAGERRRSRALRRRNGQLRRALNRTRRALRRARQP